MKRALASALWAIGWRVQGRWRELAWYAARVLRMGRRRPRTEE